jgi:hypothetical protein
MEYYPAATAARCDRATWVGLWVSPRLLRLCVLYYSLLLGGEERSWMWASSQSRGGGAPETGPCPHGLSLPLPGYDNICHRPKLPSNARIKNSCDPNFPISSRRIASIKSSRRESAKAELFNIADYVVVAHGRSHHCISLIF